MWVHTDPATHSSYPALKHWRLHCLAWMSPLLRAIPWHTSYTRWLLPALCFFLCHLYACSLVCDWPFLHSQKPTLLWPPVPGSEGSGHMDSTFHSERNQDPRALHPSSSKTNTDWWMSQMMLMECHRIHMEFHRSQECHVCAFLLTCRKFFKERGTCSPHPPDITCYSRGDWD